MFALTLKRPSKLFFGDEGSTFGIVFPKVPVKKKKSNKIVNYFIKNALDRIKFEL